MKDLLKAAKTVQAEFDAQHWRSCLIGGIAVQRWGEPRLTRDVDITLLTGFGGEESYVDALLARYRSRVPDARDFALRYRVLLLTSSDGTDLDIALGGLEFEQNAVQRASSFEFFPGLSLRTCSAEDLIVMKAFAGREIDWQDVKGIVVRHGDTLKWDVIENELRPLAELKGVPEIVQHLEKLRFGDN